MEVQRKKQETYCNTFVIVIVYKKNDDSCDKRATAVKISKCQNLALDSVYLGYHFLAVGKSLNFYHSALVCFVYLYTLQVVVCH